MAPPARSHRPLAVLAAALSLAGCATGQLRPADARLPAAFEAPMPTTNTPPLDRWWRLYDDPQLTELVEEALSQSPDAMDAASKLRQARAVRDAALLSYNPQGALSASTTHEQLGLLESPSAFGKALGGTQIIGGGVGSVGGGGLITGIASYFAGTTRVIGVEPDGAPTLAHARAANAPVDAPAGSIAVDALAPRRVGELVFPITQAYVEDVVLVDDDAIRTAQHTLWQTTRIAAEPAASVGVAALLSGAYKPAVGERVAVIISGANMTAAQLT